jgi:hypothetical protein
VDSTDSAEDLIRVRVEAGCAQDAEGLHNFEGRPVLAYGGQNLEGIGVTLVCAQGSDDFGKCVHRPGTTLFSEHSVGLFIETAAPQSGSQIE